MAEEIATVKVQNSGMNFGIFIRFNEDEFSVSFNTENSSEKLTDMDIKRVAAVSYELRDFVEELKKILKSESLLVSGCRR